MKKSCFLVLITVMAFVQSCQKSQQLEEAYVPTSSNLDDPPTPCDTLSFSPTSPANAFALQVIDPMVAFIEAHIEKAEIDSNYLALHDSVELAINNLNENTSVEEIANVYHQYLEIDTAITIAYFNNIVANASYISNEDNYATMENALLYLACNETYLVNPHKAQPRVFFRTLARMLGAGCSMRLVAGVLDTAISGAAAVAGATTGVLFYVGVASAVDAYTGTVMDAIDCHRKNQG